MRKLKVAQIGTSVFEHSFQVFQSMLTQDDLFDVVGFANVDRHDGPLQKVFQNHHEMTPEEILAIPDLDAIVIECDEKLQTHYALLAAQRNLPMHLEKPCGDDGEAFDRLIDEVEARNLVFHTGYMYRYNPAVQRTLELVRSGKLGEIYSVEAQMNCMHNVSTRQWYKEFTGGQMFVLGCHLIDLICQIQGDPQSITPLNMSVENDGLCGEDFGMALLHYPNGISLAKTTAVEPGGYLRRQLNVCGTKGTIEIRPLERGVAPEVVETEMTEIYADENGACPWGKEPVRTKFEPFNRYDAMMRAFGEMVQGKRVNPWTPEYERKLHRMVLEACGKK